jgi:hypothetical protein
MGGSSSSNIARPGRLRSEPFQRDTLIRERSQTRIRAYLALVYDQQASAIVEPQHEIGQELSRSRMRVEPPEIPRGVSGIALSRRDQQT